MLAAARQIAQRLGWQDEEMGTVPALTLTVKAATDLQLGDVRARRWELHAAFVKEAYDMRGVAPEELVGTLRGSMARVWAIHWENEHKEAWWRLAVDGFSEMGNSHYRDHPAGTCACGKSVAPSPRSHYFWDCMAARVLRSFLTHHLGVPLHSLEKSNLWLLEPPEGVQQPVWDVVCMAAISALERQRRHSHVAHDEAPYNPIVAGVAAVTDMVERMQGFVMLGKVPKKGGWERVTADHPLIAKKPDGCMMLRI
jgi:hypothetical protein